MRVWAVSLVVGLAACNSSDRPSAPAAGSGSAPAPQTAKQAMELVCDAAASAGSASSGSAERGPAIIAAMRARVTSPEIVRVLDELALDTWPSARSRLIALATQHGVSPCKLADSAVAAPTALPVAVPELSGPSEPDAGGPLLVVSPSEISLDGAAIIALDKGHVAAADLDHRTIKKLAKAPPTGRVRIAFERTIPVETATAVIRSFATNGKAEVALVCTQNHERVVLPVDMPVGTVDASMAITASKDALTLAPWEHGKAGTPTVNATLDGGLGQILRGISDATANGKGTSLPIILIVMREHLVK